MSKKIPNELFNRGLQEREAESKRKDDFADIFEEGAAGVRDGVLDMDLFRRFFRDRTDEIESGIVSKYDFPIWDTIGKVLSFDMTYHFTYVDAMTSRGRASTDDICCDTGWLSEEKEQREIHDAMKGYLVAAGALARQIGSSTYDGWRRLLVEREFGRSKVGTCFFDSEDEFAKFLGKFKELFRLLWADNEIFKRIAASQAAPHPSKKGRKGVS